MVLGYVVYILVRFGGISKERPSLIVEVDSKLGV